MRTKEIIRTLQRADFCPIGAYITATGIYGYGFKQVERWPIARAWARGVTGANAVIDTWDDGDDYTKGCWAGKKDAQKAIKLCRDFGLIKPIEEFCHDLRVAQDNGFDFKHYKE